jgi:hypothetical protein
VDERWYYLIHLGYDIVRCPAGNDGAVAQKTAEEHLRLLRQHAVLWCQATTGKRADSVPWLIGVYYDYTEDERIRMHYPKSYGYTPTLLGSMATPFPEWERVGTRV